MLTAATYNIHRCVGSDAIYRPERVVEVLKSLDADLVGLQEVDNHRLHREGSQLDLIAKECGYLPVLGETMESEGAAYGNAILSRLPVADVARHDLSDRMFEPRGALEVAVRSGNQRITVVNTHLGLKRSERLRQVKKLLGILRAKAGPLLLMGDFNEWMPFFGSDRELRARLPGVSLHRTFPSLLPLFPLDRFYCGRGMEEVRSQAVDTPLTRKASDHLPLLGSFRF